MATTPNYDINYDDSRFQKVESAKNAALNEVEKTYTGMVNESQDKFDALADAQKNWADKQTQLQNEKTDFAIKEINQNKANAKKDYLKEQSGAYVDWQKQSDEYGANAEAAADRGMSGTGWSETAQVGMFNAYQNRVATARESYLRAVQNYDNAITEARLQNSSVLAEIAFDSLQKQLEYSLQGLQYKNQLLAEKVKQKTALDSEYWGRYQDVLKQINTENAFKEQVRVNDSEIDYRNVQTQLAKKEMEKLQAEINAAKIAKTGGGSSGGGGGRKSTITKKTTKSTTANKGISKDEATTISRKDDNGGSKSSTKIDMKSALIAGGGGAPSAKNLDNKVRQGLVEEKVVNGKLTFVPTAKHVAQTLRFTNKTKKALK